MDNVDNLPITTTLAKIRAANPCASGWEKLLKHLGKTGPDDGPIDFLTIAKSNGVPDAIWCLRTVWDDHRQTCLNFVADVAEHVLKYWEDWAKEHAKEHLEAPRKAIKAARSGDRNAYAAAAAAYAYAADVYAAAAYACAYAAYAAADAAAADNGRDYQVGLLVKYFGVILAKVEAA